MSKRKILLGQEQQRVLLNALWAAFGGKPFDATEVAIKAMDDPDLMAAIDTAVPDCRLKPRRSRRRPIKILRGALSQLAEQYFDTDQLGWWRLKSSNYL